MNISSSLASINAHNTLLNTTAHNIANLKTDSYTPMDTRIVGKGNSIGINTRISDDYGTKQSQTDLVKEIPNLIVSQDVTSVNISAIKTNNEMLGALLDMKA